MKTWYWFGMSSWALITSLLMQLGIMNPTPTQQLLAGVLFLMVGVLTKCALDTPSTVSSQNESDEAARQ